MMKNKLSELLGTTKQKVLAGILCGTLVIAGTAVTAFASGSFDRLMVKVEDGSASYSTDDGATWNEGMPEEANTSYSLDDGQTWNDGLPPEGSGEKSLITSGVGTPPAAGEGNSIMVRNQDGVMNYSTDGGASWNDGVPEGAEVNEEDGKVSIKIGE